MAKSMTFIFIGRSGCGKGTQIDLLKGIFSNTLSISTGDLMRDLSKQETEVGKKIKEVLDMGGLPFDQMATTLWMHEIAYSLKGDQNLICDGFPRRVNEARDLCEFLTWLERIENTKVFVLNISREEAMKRMLKRSRERDNEQDINNRLDWYETRVVPTIDFLREKGILAEINGEQSVDEVHKDVLKVLGL